MEDNTHSEDEDSMHGDTLLPPIASTRLTRDKVVFDEWLHNKRESAYINVAANAGAARAPLTWSIPSDTDDALIISSPREYQTQLFERAKEKNTIVVLDTGAGKTLIAVLLLRHVIEQELDDRRAGKDHKLAFFLVDKIALVHQQYRVLETNLDFPMESFTGDSGGHIYTQEFWKRMRDEKTVLVCTAEIFHQCLCHSLILMEQVNLLIFDEAHHAKKNHSYARIIKDFYAARETAGGKHPRILGMTASPIDAKTNVYVAAAQLEGLMHSEIATVNDPTVFSRAAINKPTEGFIEYLNIDTPFETALWQRLNQIAGQNQVFDRLFTYSRECTTELGRWAADRVWELWLTREEVGKIEARTERDFNWANSRQPTDALDAKPGLSETVKQAYQLVEGHVFATLELDRFHLSHKLVKLIEHLDEHLNPRMDKCVIFAEQRLTVALLADLFQQPALTRRGYKVGRFMGTASSKSGDLGMSLTEQRLAIKRFRDGELNCLFATSAGEEGIDIPDCNIVIRFDLYKTVIQYIQSRGRARRPDSKFYQMVEIGNYTHRRLVVDIQDYENKLRDFCKMLPEDRLITGADYDIEYHLSKERSHRVYKVPSTGAVLTYGSSITVLARFVSSLPCPADMLHNTADYIVHNVGGEFQCEVLLPDSSPTKSAIGRRAASKQVAKCSAAFEMCLKLKKQGHLDERLQSTFVKRLPAMRNARLAISSKKRAEYPMIRKPNVWSILGYPERLFVTVIKFSNPKATERPCQPLAILTRELLPRLASFPIYFGNQKSSDVHCLTLSATLNCRPRDIEGLNQFTLRIFKDVFSKEYESNAGKMPYFFAPLAYSHDYDYSSFDGDPHAIIDWSKILQIRDAPAGVDWENLPEDIFDDKFVVDPYDGSRKFYTIRRRPDLNCSDPQLPGFPRGRYGERSKDGEYCPDIWSSVVSSIWKKSRGNLVRREDLLVIEAEYIPLRRNLLDQFNVLEDGQRRVYLVFQTLRISFIPVDVVAMAYNLPAIIYRLENNLIVLEACKSLGLDIREDLALEAMTKDSDNTEDDSREQVNLQRGMGKNYERLEFLGDSFLKMSTTIALFSQIPEYDEFRYHVDRMVLICNRNLFNNALELKVEESIRTVGFNRSSWYPDGLKILKGRKYSSRESHMLADKSIADVCEALIGAAYMTTYSQRNLDMAIQAVTKFVDHPNHRMTAYSDFYAAYKVPEWQSIAPRAVHYNLAGEMESKLGYKFKYPRLLRSAFTHPSYGSIYEGIPNYQRLEFLGDALLDMVCVDFLYQRFPGADPQWLTEHKSAMVSNQFLGCLCVSLGLQKHMVSMTGGLQKEIADYVVEITESREKAEEEAEAAGLQRASYARNYWMKAGRPPKSLPDIVESYIGAMFVDSEFKFAEVQRFFDTHIAPYFDDIHLYDTYSNNQPVTALSNILSTHFRCKT